MPNELFEEATEVLNTTKVQLMTKTGAKFIVSILLQLEHEISTQVATAATNSTKVLYNPNFLLKQSKDKRIGLMYHECAHVAYLHTFRVGDRDRQLWNMAGDYVINQLLVDNGFEIPEHGCIDPKYRDWSTDQVYDDLVENNVQPPPNFQPDLVDQEISPEEMEKLEQQVTNTVIRAVHQIQSEGGSVPQEIAVAIEKLINPKMNWKQILYEFVDSKIKENSTWRKPNKKYLPVILPSKYSDKLDHVTVAIDTSGSMTIEMLREILSEIQYINDVLKPANLVVLDCDYAIHNIYEIEPESHILDYRFTGGGGTSGVPVLNYGNENQTNLLLYFTDGQMNLKALQEPEFPMLWIISNNKNFKAPFGETVFME